MTRRLLQAGLCVVLCTACQGRTFLDLDVQGADEVAGIPGTKAINLPAAFVASLTGTGSVAAATYSTGSATFDYALDDNAVLFPTLRIFLSDDPNFCSNTVNGTLKANSKVLSFFIQNLGVAGEDEPVSGDYNVFVLDQNTAKPGRVAEAEFAHYDAKCADTVGQANNAAKSGKIHIDTAITAGGAFVSGTLAVQFSAPQDIISGTFNAGYCNLESVSIETCE